MFILDKCASDKGQPKWTQKRNCREIKKKSSNQRIEANANGRASVSRDILSLPQLNRLVGINGMAKARTKHVVEFLQQTACFYHKFLLFAC